MSDATPLPILNTRKSMLIAATALTTFIAAVAIAYTFIARIDAPNYGSWTSNQPLETKLEMLHAFNAAGGVDALVIGSSIADFGFSAERFSELKTRDEGRPYRAFNFATGGAEVRTLPKLYRIARTVAVPKAVFVVVPAQQKLDNALSNVSPDFALKNAPINEVLNHPILLSISRQLWSLPPLRNASALRELLLYGDFRGHQRVVGQAYPLNAHGDRISYLMTWRRADLPIWKSQFEGVVAPYSEPMHKPVGKDRDTAVVGQYFAKTDIDAMRELRELVENDGGKLFVMAHAAAATLWSGASTNAVYAQARRDFFQALSTTLGATLVDPTGSVSIPDYAVSDITHLNVHGAQIYTNAAYATQNPNFASASALLPMDVPPGGLLPTTDKTFNSYSALVARPPNQPHPLLRFRMLVSPTVPALPTGELFVALRTPDNVDIVVPAIALGSSDFVAEVNLPPTPRRQGLILRLLAGNGTQMQALSNPVADYEWIAAYPGLRGANNIFSTARVVALPPQRRGGEKLYVALAPGAQVPGVFKLTLAAQPPLADLAVELGSFDRAAEQLFSAALPAGLPDGTYVVRVVNVATGALFGQSPPVELTDGPASVAIETKPRTAPGNVDVTWSRIRKPTKQDWIGLFPSTGNAHTSNPMSMQFTDGKAKGKMTFQISPMIAAKLDSGDYVFALFSAGGRQEMARTESFKFDIKRSSSTISITDLSRISDGLIKLKWSGIDNPTAQDWVGLFPVGGADESRMEFMFISRSESGETEFRLSPDSIAKLGKTEHELRLFAAGGWTQLARSAAVKVASPDPKESLK